MQLFRVDNMEGLWGILPAAQVVGALKQALAPSILQRFGEGRTRSHGLSCSREGKQLLEKLLWLKENKRRPKSTKSSSTQGRLVIPSRIARLDAGFKLL